MEQSEIERLELDLLVDAIYRRWGYDFRSYARASLKRRVEKFVAHEQLPNMAALIPLVLRDEAKFQNLLFTISVTTTEMFRDPWVYVTLREKVLPFLSTFPFINIWVAGCSTGEEAYSVAILFKEEGLYDRARIYATDFNVLALEKARARIYALNRMQEYSQNYQHAGGRRSLSDYYLAQYDSAIFDPSLQERITFASHNLATDGVFGEMHLILCRNVLIYFERSLQQRAIGLFRQSLRRRGFLCLGSRESLDFSGKGASRYGDFLVFASNERIYQYQGGTAPLGGTP